jgi:SAM-dependent methyltransferase
LYEGKSVSIIESGNSTIASTWDRYAVAYQNAANLPTDVVSYGPGIGTEAELRLLGPLTGKRFVDLGCGGAQSAIAAAKHGAIAIGVDCSVEQLAFARRIMEQEEVRVELKHGDMAELAFQRADSVDIVFSAMSFQYMPDLNRVFRQAHRVLKLQGTFVFSIPHPAASMVDPYSITTPPSQLSLEPETVSIRRGYFDPAPIEERHGDITFTEYHHTLSDIFMGLVRTGFDVDAIIEPEVPSGAMVPKALIMRARKEA